jgi:hypothetical protein
MACPQLADGADGLQVWKVAANILNKQSRTGGNGYSYLREIGRGGMGWSDVAQDRDQRRTLVNIEIKLRVP